jgi:flavin reductase (DIM6/NTAB) family NADH-FMN oxidoreductase RutF/rubredoxin
MKYKAFHKLSYGLYIIACESEGKKFGYIGNTAFQVTAEPPQIAISCNKKNTTTDKIIESKSFSLSVLKKEASTSVIGEFGFMSGDTMDKFKNVETQTASTGAPIVKDSSVAWFDCEVISTHDVGSHILIIGEVKESDVLSDEEPLTYKYYREKYKMLAPKNAPTYIDKQKLEAEKTEEEEDKTDKKAEKPESESELREAGATYTCKICGFQYNPDEGDPTAGIPPGTPFEDLPEDYKCPICNAGKEYFNED